MVAGIIPTLASFALLGVATVAAWIATGAAGFAASIARSSNDGHEQLGWAITALVALAVVVYVVVQAWNEWSFVTRAFAILAPATLVVVALGAKK